MALLTGHPLLNHLDSPKREATRGDSVDDLWIMIRLRLVKPGSYIPRGVTIRHQKENKRNQSGGLYFSALLSCGRVTGLRVR